MAQPSLADLQLLAEQIEDKRGDFIDVLTYVSTYKAAEYEIDHAVNALLGTTEELAGVGSHRIDTLAAYLPSNVILFSYILYAVIPSVFCRRVLVRPSLRGREVAWAINSRIRQLLKLPIEFEMYKSRKEFLLESVSSAEVIAFTGRCRNSFEVLEHISDKQLFLYFGSGVNPAVIGPKADLDLAARDVTRARIFNSGQDCLCPDLILVHEKVIDDFLQLLSGYVDSLRYGPLNDPRTDFSNLVYPNIAEFCADFVEKHADRVVHRGTIDVLSRMIEPVVMLRHIKELRSYEDYPEFFAPIFNLAIYRNYEEIESLILSEGYRRYAMGVSLYGTAKLDELFEGSHMVTHDCSLFDINYGNRPFGGKGLCSSYVKFGGALTAQGVLISREVRRFLW